eukprot:TRINITY_DN11841_c0_g1_i1.p2 TRINITY_DN11841_c0_g1~~TRINITY_DN11841_c0_g1_i1.p2  ORF type:complete len:104 (-),score=20.43 TRINITY_DN11841_c0_g1_i1:12-323(-)
MEKTRVTTNSTTKTIQMNTTIIVTLALSSLLLTPPLAITITIAIVIAIALAITIAIVINIIPCHCHHCAITTSQDTSITTVTLRQRLHCLIMFIFSFGPRTLR